MPFPRRESEEKPKYSFGTHTRVRDRDARSYVWARVNDTFKANGTLWVLTKGKRCAVPKDSVQHLREIGYAK